MTPRRKDLHQRIDSFKQEYLSHHRENGMSSEWMRPALLGTIKTDADAKVTSTPFHFVTSHSPLPKLRHTLFRHPTPMSRTQRTTVSDFSSAEYWSTRFTTETSFEWLLPSSQIIQFILESFHHKHNPESEIRVIKCLHLGCGTSTLGMELEDALRQKLGDKVDIQVIDSDYVAGSITLSTPRPILNLNALDLSDLRTKSEGGWDLIIDKSTADAISCGPLIDDIEPINVLCSNLAEVTKKGTRWISISYSPTRFSFLSATTSGPTEGGARKRNGEEGGDGSNAGEVQGGEGGWKVIERKFLASTSLPEGRRWKDASGVERVVFEPETGVWGWVLERV
jgi:hypothetical protein